MEMHYDKCVDWWSLGILMFEMLTGDVSSYTGSLKWVQPNFSFKDSFPCIKQKEDIGCYTQKETSNTQLRYLGCQGYAQ